MSENKSAFSELSEEIFNEEVAPIKEEPIKEEPIKEDEPIKEEPIAAEVIEKEGPTKEEPIVDDNEEIIVNESSIFEEPKGLDPTELKIEDWTKVAKFLDIEITDNNADALKSAYQEKLEKQKAQVDLTKFTPDAQALIEHVNKGGDPLEILNPLKPLDDILALSPEDRVRKDLKLQGFSETKIENYIERLQEEEEFDSYVAELDKSINQLKKEKIVELVAKANEKKAAELEAIKNQNRFESQEIINKLDTIEKFMGVALPKEAKIALKADVENGVFFKELDNAEAQTNAYLFRKYGQKIEAHYNEKLKAERRAGYNEGVQKLKDGLHNTPPKNASSGHGDTNKASSGAKGGFGELKNELG